ncbi:MAG: CDP-glycerol glycerophosphotransferase family protein [Acetobacter sp.]|nr:CDP-glycerol glycerophosphotransferase family protein [Bacteroides sp.]MCM1340750.1 CDP-glycerol glycerophosphotransferase family protein [Acetobacter sp.]MCM1433087.1 CDP-glycerol glycerophosphotransferase family protein [Clostridiales bacterium]
MKAFLITLLRLGMAAIYAPMKRLKTENRIVYLSRQSDSKSLDMILLEKQINKFLPDTEQIFRLRTIPDGLGAKIKYCFDVIGDMYYLATSKVAILDTYSIAVSCLKHKDDLRVIQMWHALGAIKKFGFQSIGTKEGRDKKVSAAMRMHKNYDYILAPSKATAEIYLDAFGYNVEKIKICSLPRVDEILSDNDVAARFFNENPDLAGKKIVLYLPTFREREAYVAQKLKVEFADDMLGYHLIVSTHPLFSKVKKDDRFSFKGEFSTYDLMKVADVIITDYSACAFEASLLMKPLYFFVPDYNEYNSERGLNIDLYSELPGAVFEDAAELCNAIKFKSYDLNLLYSFKSKYIENTNDNNAEILAKFISMQLRNF